MGLSYCAFVRDHPEQGLHRAYHDTQYGFPLASDAELFGRLILEINQAGLSWTTILKKQEAFRQAFAGFDPEAIAAFGEADRARLLADAGIIRNRLKVDAVLANAGTLLSLRVSHGSFQGWLDAHHPRDLTAWVKLFRATFRFTGGEIVKEFLLSTGYLPGAHDAECPVHAHILTLGPPWAR